MYKNQNTIFSLEETATILGISSATVRNWTKLRRLQPIKQLDRLVFYASDIENLRFNMIKGNVDKLNKRANKRVAKKIFIPKEYLENSDIETADQINNIVSFIQENKIQTDSALLIVCLSLLYKEELLSQKNLDQTFNSNFKNIITGNQQIQIEIKSWLKKIRNIKLKENYQYLLNTEIPNHRDILGLIYQSLLMEGKKSQNGSYYTPQNIVDDIVGDYLKKDEKILDPCCGSGQFLLAFSDKTVDPKNLFGIDVDDIAVRIARLNLLIKFKNIDFKPNIFCKNTLLDLENSTLFNKQKIRFENFDLIATNPPWGVHFDKQEKSQLKQKYPIINSHESFSYFLKKSIDLLKHNGILSFILPESFLNVKTHQDIRKYILDNTQIKKIIYLDRVFENVFTPVVRLDVQKISKQSRSFFVHKKNENYKIDQKRLSKNAEYIFDIHINKKDSVILNKVFSVKYTRLKNQADWALGIVTGDNKKYISDIQKNDYEEVLKGKDIEKFTYKKSSNYINFLPKKLQQVAPEHKYRVKEKLIYRFISKYLIFAFDNKQRLTLNSANIVIPKIKDYPVKVILALFNSSLYQFIFQKKFSSIKVLRNHLEQLPLPLWDKKVFNKICNLVDQIMASKNEFDKLDNLIMKNFMLNNGEINYIRRIIK